LLHDADTIPDACKDVGRKIQETLGDYWHD